MYAWISRAANGETIKADYQVEVCSEEIGTRGGRIGQVFTDNSLSAWKKNVARPDWGRLMDRLESGACDGVMFYDVTRFSRKIREGERLIEAAERGMLVWSLTGSYPLDTADGRRHFREDMVSAASESAKNAERIRHGKKRRARKGKLAGGQRGYGMPGLLPKPDGWTEDDPREMTPAGQVAAERDVIAECARRILAGEPVPDITRDLNARGLRTVNGARWTRSGLAAMLNRPAIAGLATLNGDVITTLTGIEPVITTGEWERLAAMLAGRPRGRPVTQVHILSGAMICGTCGQPVHGMTRSELPPYPDGSPVRVYRCRKDASHFGCGRNSIDAQAAEAVVEHAVKARLGDPRRAEGLARRLTAVRSERARLDAEITTLDEAADNLAIKTVTWGAERVDKAMQPILRKLDALKAERDALDTPDDPGVALADAVTDWDNAREAGDTPALRAMVRRAFPDLVLQPATARGDRSPARFTWDGPRPARH